MPKIAASLLLPLAFGFGAGGAYAHGTHPKHARQPAVQGIVVSTSKQNVTVQTQSGSVSVPLMTSTQFVRYAKGSTADVTAGAFAEVRSATGATVASTITLLPSIMSGHPGKHTHKSPQSGKTSKRAGTGVGRSGAQAKMHRGQVVSLVGNTLTLRDARGRTASYALAANTTVIKVMVGTVNDLAAGQTVRVFKDAAGAARFVEILSS